MPYITQQQMEDYAWLTIEELFDLIDNKNAEIGDLKEKIMQLEETIDGLTLPF